MYINPYTCTLTKVICEAIHITISNTCLDAQCYCRLKPPTHMHSPLYLCMFASVCLCNNPPLASSQTKVIEKMVLKPSWMCGKWTQKQKLILSTWKCQNSSSGIVNSATLIHWEFVCHNAGNAAKIPHTQDNHAF